MAEKADIMRKVRALLDKAASTTFEPERDSLLSKADQLMTAYVIESWELELAKPANAREKPVLVEYDYSNTEDYDLNERLADIFGSLARHCRVKLGWYGSRHSKLVGYQSDIDYLDMLFTNIRLHLQINMIPHASTTLSYEENLALLKEAGYKWQQVYEQLLPLFPERFPQNLVRAGAERNNDIVVNGKRYRRGLLDQGRGIGVGFTKTYTEYCKEHNRERIYANPEVYKRSFLEGYVWRIRRRLEDLDAGVTQGQALVLRGREEDLLEEFYKLFPDRRPHPPGCDCDYHHRCNDPKCQRMMCVAARTPVKYSRASPRALRVDASARERGRKSADSADLFGGRNNLGGRKEIT